MYWLFVSFIYLVLEKISQEGTFISDKMDCDTETCRIVDFLIVWMMCNLYMIQRLCVERPIGWFHEIILVWIPSKLAILMYLVFDITWIFPRSMTGISSMNLLRTFRASAPILQRIHVSSYWTSSNASSINSLDQMSQRSQSSNTKTRHFSLPPSPPSLQPQNSVLEKSQHY